MNAFALTAIVTIALLALSLVLFVAVWLIERLQHVRVLLVKSAAEILLCCAIGLLAAIAYYIGYRREAALNEASDVATISTR